MRIKDLTESSGYSLRGSFTKDLLTSKVWLLDELRKINKKYGTIYVLGSWYGNLAIILKLLNNLKYDKLINVETNKKFLQVSKQILNDLGAKNIQYMLKDANSLDYSQLGKNGVVINTSLTDMKGIDWFNNIPTNTLVVMQARDNDVGQKFSSPNDIIKKFPVNVIYQGVKKLSDPETDYNRFMVIGIK
jgi:SAM-dependent methyltransferase